MREGLLKVNIGCGDKALPGWENLDNSLGIIMSRFPGLGERASRLGLVKRDWWAKWRDRGVKWVDVRKGLPFPSGAAGYVYTSHMLEHLTPQKAEDILRECYRILGAGGLLRVVTPDLEHLFLMYNSLKRDFNRDEPEGKDAPADFFLKCMGIIPGQFWPGYDGPKGGRLLLGQNKHMHRWLYDYDSLYVLLRKVGFGEIRRVLVREGEIADLDMLEENYVYPESLFVEAIK